MFCILQPGVTKLALLSSRATDLPPEFYFVVYFTQRFAGAFTAAGQSSAGTYCSNQIRGSSTQPVQVIELYTAGCHLHYKGNHTLRTAEFDGSIVSKPFGKVPFSSLDGLVRLH